MFKRCLQMAVLALALCLILPGAVQAADPGLVLDGKQLSMVESPPVIVNGRMLAPVWVIGEALDMNIDWDHRSQTAQLRKEGLKIRITIGEKTAFVNDEEVRLDEPARIYFGRTMVPLRFISEAIGAKVEWDAANNNAVLTSPQVIEEQQEEEKPNTTTRVHFLDLESGESILIDLPGGKHIMIDTGSAKDAERVVDYLQAQKVEKIELLVATHPDPEHIGALSQIVKTFKIDKVIDSGFGADAWSHESYLRLLSAAGIPREEDNKQTVAFDDITLRFLTGTEKWPDFYDEDADHDPDDYSVVCLLQAGGIKFLFTGDAGERVEKTLTNAGIQANILKVGRHGSSVASSLGFLQQVQPEAAVITVPSQNRSGYPYPEVLKRLDEQEIKVYRTDTQGTVVVTVEQGQYSIKTEQQN
jgi:beta-lactamase superfamily II metal-dependent hydrolase